MPLRPPVRKHPPRRNSGAPPFASNEEYEDWKRRARAAQKVRAHTAAGRLAAQHDGDPEETGVLSIGHETGHTPDGRSLGQRIRFGRATWRVADLPQSLYRLAPSHEGGEAIAAYIRDHRVPPTRGNPKKSAKKPARRNPLPAAAITVAMTLLPYVVSALGRQLSAFNALPRAQRKTKLIAILNSRWLYAIPAILPVARLAAKSGVAVDALLDALAGHGQVAVRAGGAAAQAALAKQAPARANPRGHYRFPVGTRVVVVTDIVDIKKGGRRFLAARAGDRGTVIDNRGTSDWPRVRLDDGRRITVDAESGELRREAP